MKVVCAIPHTMSNVAYSGKKLRTVNRKMSEDQDRKICPHCNVECWKSGKKVLRGRKKQVWKCKECGRYYQGETVEYTE